MKKIGKKQTARQITLMLVKNTDCRLRPSKISGIGVFAVRTIPAGTKLFPGVKRQAWYRFSAEEFASCDLAIKTMIDDFLVVEKDGTVLVPRFGFDGMDLSFFLNHSKKPNVKTIDVGFNFVTLRKIKRGEELTVDYGTYDYKYLSRK
ncbi:MAG: hypothetical protein A2729_00935 [Candidatus Buchananbacteria bacterium RIFCSPHIGHO2_01_FULL_39_14]|uniref:SET domain-containing protein n=2 Tax=Candidatus Buchananiibacteriota TaxID=1817903 RepID=A0A1G1YUR5_9BACT|nr:MAG: hypothetical protein A2729_00935 [Candidatus Buchananbacteria bacterium RIFCSPHIGHO2_01_FULL_39_14]OGY49524.1 MAG: hypothetical protein A3D39_00215 [Candidatus Buchananbacteria bacterium RIFCSPHIGHO2_02_FULL_39_17]OGY55999.1 MAG: hypothetical protein A2912_03415 [Candidatus Buchananbacteria bacterium RIFCSPLOWO2_01_FULL_40_23b]